MKILALNCGSTSVRFRLIETDRRRMARDADRHLAGGKLEAIGGDSSVAFQVEGRPVPPAKVRLRDHREAIALILDWLISGSPAGGLLRSRSDLDAAGHRVVHGGAGFSDPVRIDPAVVAAIEACADQAPLHNRPTLLGIRATLQLLGPAVPQVAVFDTAFHRTMPESSYLYALPYEISAKHGIRRYGFHGTSHQYIALRYRRLRRLRTRDVRIISLHLGGGSSACAIREGKSLDTSMGFTPLEGLVMATRCGDLDPAIPLFLARRTGATPAEIEAMLVSRSGLLGLSGTSSDMRTLLELKRHDPRALLAIEIFCRRVRKYIGAYFADMGGADAIVFTGGIGENAPEIRRRTCRGLESLGLRLDQGRNRRLVAGAEGEISRRGSTLRAYVIPTDEELIIARQTARLLDRPRPTGPGLAGGSPSP